MGRIANGWQRLLPLTRALPDRAASGVRWAVAAAVAGTVAYTFYSEAGPSDPILAEVFDSWLYNAIMVLAGLLCAARARAVAADRGAWAAAAAGILCWAAADIYWTIVFADDVEPPYPSPADALYMLFYAFSYVAMALLVRGSVSGFHRSMYLDGLIGALAISGLAAAFVIDPILSDVGGSFAAVAVNIAYPVADLLLIVIVVGVFALTGWRPPRAWALLGLGFGIFAVADSLYLYRVADASYTVGTVLDALWLIGIVALSIAAWQPLARAGTWRLEGWPVLVAPLLFTLAAITLLALGNVTHVNEAAFALGLATLACAFARMALTLREVRALPETRRHAETDELTGLPNRRLFYDRLRAAIDHAANRGEALAVLMIDLDRFKELNDTLGHYAGDVLLQQLGPRLADVVRGNEALARLGGDEFAVLLPDAESADQVARRIGTVLERPFVIGGVTVHVEASTGIAIYPDHGTDADGLLQRADVAMYQAKDERSSYRFYAPERDRHSPERLALMGELHHAIETGEPTLHYQPKAEVGSGGVPGRVSGVEALVRWIHPQRGLIPPDDFIPMAEQTGVMRPLTLWVLEQALAQCRRWLDAGRPLEVSVNVSATNLLDDEFRPDVQRLLAELGVPAELLKLEITENVLMSDPLRAREVIAALSDLGVEVSLDDFGTGFSSLSYLHELAVDELKIDRSFVIGMSKSESDGAIVRSVIDLARNLGITIVAEGVEDEPTLEALAGFGCDLVQGFFLSRPLPAADLDAWFEEREAGMLAAADSAATRVPL